MLRTTVAKHSEATSEEICSDNEQPPEGSNEEIIPVDLPPY